LYGRLRRLLETFEQRSFLMNPDRPEVSVHSPIQEKIEVAEELYRQFSEVLRQNPSILRLLAAVEQSVGASRDIMLEVGVVAACRHCDEEEGGSCCGAGIENRYNPTLLLINLLLGATLPLERYSENSCYFLGERGCRLQVRHVLCVNYLCHRIQDLLEHENLIRLQTVTGEEMDKGFLLHETIKKLLSDTN
jgi:hypothetical protein